MLPKLGVARPADGPAEVVRFYTVGLGFEVLAEFADHACFGGAILGHAGAPWHLEFTHQRGHTVGRAPTRDHLLVLYLPDRPAWEAAVARTRDSGFRPVPSWDPYWDASGATFEDPDGYRVVLQNAAWEL